jgi:DeoR/GlpR family transcriptional regulator of sugar metabolism
MKTDSRRAGLKRVMIEHSSELIPVADHTELNRVIPLHLCSLNDVDVLVTDRDAQVDIIDRIQSAGVRVLLAG